MPRHRGHREGEGHHRGIGVAREHEFRSVSPLEEVEKAKTTINNIVNPDDVHEEMKHIPKDYKVKMYIPRESANQNVAIHGEKR